MKHIIIVASLLGGMLYQAQAQELTVGLNLAQAGSTYKLPNGKVQLKPSIGAEIRLQIPLNKKFKILTGLEFFKYRSKATLADNQTYTHNQIDDQGSAFEYRVSTSSYSETHNTSAFRIPLLLQYTTGAQEKTQWHFNGGLKLLLPTKITTKASASKLTTKGYYPDVNAEVHSLPQHGFGDVNNWQSTGSYTTKAGWMFSTGTGISFKISANSKTRLYTGLYFDYGINNLKAGKEVLSVITYNSQNVANVQANGSMAMAEATSLKMTNIGLQIKLTFDNKSKAVK